MLLNNLEQNADAAKITCLYQKYKYLMLNQAYEILRDEYLAEDAVQQSFVRIMNNIHKIQDVDSHRTRAFLVIICRNIAINIYHKCVEKDKNNPCFETSVLESHMDPLDIVIDNIMVEQTFQYIKKLKPIYQEVLLLRYMDYNYDTIASLLHISNDIARKRFERGKGELIKMLQKEGLYEKKACK